MTVVYRITDLLCGYQLFESTEYDHTWKVLCHICRDAPSKYPFLLSAHEKKRGSCSLPLREAKVVEASCRPQVVAWSCHGGISDSDVWGRLL